MISAALCFNSRPRTTGDVRARDWRHAIRVSIHARARRATGGFCGPHPLACFNSRPRTTGDGAWQADVATDDVSIHARARRATALELVQKPLTKFQFTPAHDGRLL